MTSTDHEPIKGSAVFSFEAESFLALERLKVGRIFRCFANCSSRPSCQQRDALFYFRL